MRAGISGRTAPQSRWDRRIIVNYRTIKGLDMKDTTTTLYLAAAVRDAQTVNARPGAVAVRNGHILAAGAVEPVERKALRRGLVNRIELPGVLILPAMVNAHAHLQLTSLGPQPHHGDFSHWLETIIQLAPKTDVEIVHAVTEGARLSRQAGVGYLGDIASAAAVGARIASRLPGVSYLECFGVGAGEQDACESLRQLLDPKHSPFDLNDPNVHVGVQPHAPYSAGCKLYDAAVRLSRERALRLSTHLAETREEIEFVRDAAGPLADMLKRLGKWDDAIRPQGAHPIDWLAETLKRSRWLLAHCNYIEDHHFALLAKARASVAYCPVASDYFGHRNHRYRDMLAAGVNVCLGTDSIVCQSAQTDGTDQLLGILPQMRYLYRRDRVAPDVLLKMATINGLLALSLPEKLATLSKGAPAQLVAVPIDGGDSTDPLTQVLENNKPAQMINVKETARPQ